MDFWCFRTDRCILRTVSCARANNNSSGNSINDFFYLHSGIICILQNVEWSFLPAESTFQTNAPVGENYTSLHSLHKTKCEAASWPVWRWSCLATIPMLWSFGGCEDLKIWISYSNDSSRICRKVNKIQSVSSPIILYFKADWSYLTLHVI